MILTLIRHTSVAVAPGICYGQSDVDVAASFVAEAEAVRRKLAGRRFDAVYASPLQRCRKLAAHCGHHAPHFDRRLMEMNFGDWELKSWDAISDPQLARWYADWVNEVPSGGESARMLIARVADFVAELRCGQARQVAIFTHAGVIRAFGVVLGRFAVEAGFDFPVAYGDIFDFPLAREGA